MYSHARASVFALCLASRALCTPVPSAQVLTEHESITRLPASWKRTSAAGDDEQLYLRVALRHPNKNFLQIARDVSDPTSPQYGKYLSAGQLDASLADIDRAAEAVEAWLKANNAASIIRKPESVHFSATVAQASKMLDATFAKYSHDGQAPVLRTQAYSIPEDLTNEIDFIFPTIQFFAPKKNSISKIEARQHIPNKATCANSVCPDQLQKKYNINYQPPDSSSGSQIAIAGFLEQYASPADLKQFYDKYRLRNDTGPYTFNVELVNNGTNPTSSNVSGVEAMLDLDYTMPFTDPLPITYFSTGGRPPALDDHGVAPIPLNQTQSEPYFEFLEYILAKENPPQVISISYSDTEQTVPFSYATRVCDQFAKLAARGVSVVGSSGDGGAAGTYRGDCIGPDGEWHLLPTFPSSCPWITSVGSTAAYGGGASFSSGGFSNYFGRESWQDADAQSYIDQLNGTRSDLYNQTGRAIPDVSLVGDDYLIVSAGDESAHDGTSASTPVFASMIALLNDIRLRAGKPVLGHLNPLLYSEAARSVFTDVTTGFNTGCATANRVEPGWDALKGWDPVTGLGEPDFAKLRSVLT